jgi:DNA-binding NarL/FixJ family response regulator
VKHQREASAHSGGSFLRDEHRSAISADDGPIAVTYSQSAITSQPNTDTNNESRDNNESRETVPLTPAEARVLPLLPAYRTLAAISTELDIGRPTVRTHVENIYEKHRATTRAEAVKLADSVGLRPPSVTAGQPPSFTST